MVEQKRILEKRLETIKKQLTNNVILGVIAILILVFVPWIAVENFRFKVSLENIIAFIALIVCIARGFSLRSKREELEAELSVYSEEEKHKKIKVICEYCHKKFESTYELETHQDDEYKKERTRKKKRIASWAIGITSFLGFGVYFLARNKINLIPVLLIGFLVTPFFDKAFDWYKRKTKILKYYEFDWWGKISIIIMIILIFALVNLVIPQCPNSCNDGDSCTNDFCSSETGYTCMNTIKLSCKGNGICENGEYGTADCPSCSDGDKCTANSYNPASKRCIHVEMVGCTR